MGIFNSNKKLPVTFVSQESHRIFCRTFECPKCLAANRPFGGLKCLLYGARRGYFTYWVPSLHKQEPGLTPHLISLVLDKPNPNKDGLIGIEVVCCVSTCGVRIWWDDIKKMFVFEKIKGQVRQYWLPLKDVRTLLKDSKGYGFKI